LSDTNVADHPVVSWEEKGETRSARWRSEGGVPPPKRVVVAEDHMTADKAYHLACEGTAMLWRGDFQNARQLLQAMARRVDKKPAKEKKPPPSLAESFHLGRMAQAQRARTLGMLLIPFNADHTIPLPRAPELQEACLEAYGEADGRYVASLRELLGVIGAHEWRRNGVEVPALGSRIHPHYGVWSPVRGEYVELVATAPLPNALGSTSTAFDVGTGTGVLAAVLAKRGVAQVIATDQDPRALACARENIVRLGLLKQVQIIQANLFPGGKAALIVCNPPWLPAKPSSSLEHSIYDLDSRMLRGFLDGAGKHLLPGGEAWLILSDLAEHIGLRKREELTAWIAKAGLMVIDRIDVRPHHPKAADKSDPLHAARAKEVTSLWRLATG
jgi:methylase of polypeptide subunit release factors